MWLDVPLPLTSTRAAREPAHSTRCSPWQKKKKWTL